MAARRRSSTQISIESRKDLQRQFKRSKHRKYSEMNNEYTEHGWTAEKIMTTFATRTSAHGFPNAYLLWVAQHRRCAVALSCLSSLLVCIGVIFGCVGVISLIQPGYYGSKIKVIKDKEGLSLPRIVLSNSVFFNYSALKEYNVSRYEASLVTALLVGETAYTATLEKRIDEANSEYYKLLQRLKTTPRDVWTLLSYKCHELIIECQFNTKHIPGMICCKEHFQPILGAFGVSFLSTGDFIQKREAVAAGLTLTLRIPLQPLDLDWNYLNRDATLLKSGLRVNIIDSNMNPSADTGSVVPVSGKERILVALTYHKHDNTGLYQSLFPWLDATADCIAEDAPLAEQSVVADECMAHSLHVCAKLIRGCDFITNPFWDGVDRICDFKDQIAMTRTLEPVACRFDHIEYCGNICKEDIYSFTTQSCPLLHYKDNTTDNKWAVEGAFTMFYSHLDHTLITQKRTDLLELLSSLGGQVGLFMGASLVTLGEILTFLSALIVHSAQVLARGGWAPKGHSTLI